MPSGDFAAGLASQGNQVEIPVRIPPVDAAASATQPAQPTAVEEKEIQARGLSKECVLNASEGFAPSDIHGAVTPTNLVTVTNVSVGVYRKSDCGRISRLTLKTFFSQNGGFSIPSTTTLFDPRVLFDRPGNRCLLVTDSEDSTNTDQFLYVAASTSSSCTSWNRYRLALSSGASFFCKNAVGDFYDYPNAGYNRDALVVTSNNFGSSVVGAILKFDKPALYSGAGGSVWCFNNQPTNIAPAVVAGTASSVMYILAPRSSSILRLALNTSGPTLTATPAITIGSWSTPPLAKQPNGQPIDSLDGRFQSASKQIGSSIWNVHTIASGANARWRLYKLSTTGTSPLFTFFPTTSSCPNSDDLFNASLDTNSATSGSGLYVTSTRTCRTVSGTGNLAHLIFRGANDSTSGWVFNLVQTSASQFTGCSATSGCRWGDYSATQIDPNSTANAWGFNQLATGSSQFSWNTRGAKATP